jgi:hypothetical protein
MAYFEQPTPQPFKVIGQSTNLSNSWDNYIKRFEYYIHAAGITKDERKKLSQYIWEEKNYKTNTRHQSVRKILIAKQSLTDLNHYFNPRKNIAYERHYI